MFQQTVITKKSTRLETFLSGKLLSAYAPLVQFCRFSIFFTTFVIDVSYCLRSTCTVL